MQRTYSELVFLSTCKQPFWYVIFKASEWENRAGQQWQAGPCVKGCNTRPKELHTKQDVSLV